MLMRILWNVANRGELDCCGATHELGNVGKQNGEGQPQQHPLKSQLLTDQLKRSGQPKLFYDRSFVDDFDDFVEILPSGGPFAMSPEAESNMRHLQWLPSGWHNPQKVIYIEPHLKSKITEGVCAI